MSWGRERVRRCCAVAVPLCMALLVPVMVMALDDPFADLEPAPVSELLQDNYSSSWWDNLLFRREVMLSGGLGYEAFDRSQDLMSRFSAGFEVQKRFATATRTLAAVDYQGRMVWRNHPMDSNFDAMGHTSRRWKYETHNAYIDLFSIVGEPGDFNLKLGYFYQPFGLNWQTDTHATLLQLSNHRLFGSGHDWQGVLYGALGESLDYSVGYLAGSGPDHNWRGQAGMGVARLGLSNSWLFERGLEGGLSVAGGERVDPHGKSRLKRGGRRGDSVVEGWRGGGDVRQRFDSTLGTLTLLSELAVGQDDGASLLSELTQAEWLHPSRQWGAAVQHQGLWSERVAGGGMSHDERVAAVLTWYMRNDVGSANLHWVAVGIERHLRMSDAPEDTLFVVQYYRYW